MTTGAALRDERIRAGLSLSAMARRMRRDRVTVWRWEGQATVTDAQAAEYRAALVERAA
jgi:transcriptional regulator with XRE-family HTH domain